MKCERNHQRLWTSSSCIASKDDFVFITDDCEQAIAVVGKPPDTVPWASSDVLRIYARGELKRSYAGGPMLDSKHVKRANGAWDWLAERKPRYLRGARGIELEVRTRPPTRLPFEGVALGDETLVSNRAEPPDEPRPPRLTNSNLLQAPDTPPPPTTVKPPVPLEPPAPAPNKPRTKRTTVCDRMGCTQDVEVPAGPIPDSNGQPTCKNAGEACDNVLECCGQCIDGRCR